MKAGMKALHGGKGRVRRRMKGFLANRRVKDRLFCYIFEKDRKALLELYNALNGTDYQDEQALQIVTLKNVVYMSMNNDAAFILAGTMELYEHQSTECPNMPLRLLLYIAAEYEALADRMGVNLYGKSLIKLPAPRCVVFYNGDEDMEDERLLRLTDAFADAQGRRQESSLELTVRVLNINYGHNEELMRQCRRLEEYSLFTAKIKEMQGKGYSFQEAADAAVSYCMEQGIMADILGPFRAEVKKMLLTEYDEKKTMRLFRKEAKEEGIREGREEGKKEGRKVGIREERERLAGRMLVRGIPAEEISQITGLSQEEINDIRNLSENMISK